MNEDEDASPSVDLRFGDCLAVLRQLPDESVDVVITDPPYGLAEHKPERIAAALIAWTSGDRDHVPDGRGFMGRAWDAFVPPPAVWDECLRVLKPGGHLAAFAGSRTYDLMGMSIRLAGFEIRDGLQWLYGSGMPKGQNVGKAIDKMAGAEREVVGTKVGRPGYSLAAHKGRGVMDSATYGTLSDPDAECAITAPATPEAARWEGWNTSLKPSQEPIVLARKPLGEKTVAANVLVHGTGGVNVDACRVGDGHDRASGGVRQGPMPHPMSWGKEGRERTERATGGRWPSNVLLTHAPECHEPGECAPGGEITVRVYGDDSGDVDPGSSPASLLDRQRAVLAGSRACSTGDTDLGLGASAFYRSQGTRSSAQVEELPLLRGVERVLRLTEAPGSPVGCPACRRSDDGRVRRVLEAGRAGLPSLLDALAGETRQASEAERSRAGRSHDHLASSDAPRRAGRSSCTGQSSSGAAGPDSPTAGGTSSRTSGTGSPEPLLAALLGSTPASSTSDDAGSAGTAGHSECRRATSLLLTLWAFDVASRFVPESGAYARDIAFSLPQCPVAELDAQSGTLTSGANPTRRGSPKFRDAYGEFQGQEECTPARGVDSGGASRFYPSFRYQAKAPASERPKIDGKGWPTVKPQGLMRWLVRLLTPPGGVVLDPFAGTGSTLQAARDEGFASIGIERDEFAYLLSCKRLGLPELVPATVTDADTGEPAALSEPVAQLPEPVPVDPVLAAIAAASSYDELLALWREHRWGKDSAYNEAAAARRAELEGAAA